MLNVDAIASELGRAGYVHLRGPVAHADFLEMASGLGPIVGEEVIALRPGAHAYVAKPGRVPLHTDHPEVAFIGWRADEQDELDGASLLLDSRPVVDTLSQERRNLLREVRLVCPPLAGGPPTLTFPVLRETRGALAVFCSPWLRSASNDPRHQLALDHFRDELTAYATRATVERRLRTGDVLFVDNGRVLHGRRAIGEHSRRRLHRLWVGARPSARRSQESLPCPPLFTRARVTTGASVLGFSSTTGRDRVTDSGLRGGGSGAPGLRRAGVTTGGWSGDLSAG